MTKNEYPKTKVSATIPFMIEERSGFNAKAFQVVDSDRKRIGFESIIGQATVMGSKTTIHIPENHIFAVILTFCEYSKRSLIYIVDRQSRVFFYKENHEFIPDTMWADNTMSIIKNLLKESRGQMADVELG